MRPALGNRIIVCFTSTELLPLAVLKTQISGRVSDVKYLEILKSWGGKNPVFPQVLFLKKTEILGVIEIYAILIFISNPNLFYGSNSIKYRIDNLMSK